MAHQPFPYKKVLILGATSGIGEALARRIVESSPDTRIIATGRREEKLVKLADELGHDRVSIVKQDVTDISGIPNFVKKYGPVTSLILKCCLRQSTRAQPSNLVLISHRIVGNHGDLDYIMFNSGIQRGVDWSKPETVDMRTIDNEFVVNWILTLRHSSIAQVDTGQTNYFAHLALTKEFLPYLMEKSSETVMCYVTSGLAIVPLVRCSNYCASKAAVHHWVMCLREQLSNTKIRVVELMPPAVHSKSTAPLVPGCLRQWLLLTISKAELHDPKNQPDIPDPDIGMPVNEFTDEAYAGLTGREDYVPVQMTKHQFDAIEPARMKIFRKIADAVSGKKSS